MIPSINEERKIIAEKEKAKFTPLTRPKKYNVIRPGDEQFNALPIDEQFARVVKIELSLKRRLKKIAKIKRMVAARARRRKIAFKSIVRSNKLIKIETIPI